MDGHLKIMKRLAFAFACLVSVGHSRRMQAPLQQLQRSPGFEDVMTGKSADAQPAAVLASLLVALKPGSAFNPSGVFSNVPAFIGQGLRSTTHRGPPPAVADGISQSSSIAYLRQSSSDEVHEVNLKRGTVEMSTVGMQVESALLLGDGTGLDAIVAEIAPDAGNTLDVVVVLSLGADHQKIQSAVQGLSCPVYFSETYGILGYDAETGRNIELLEKGRGSEYGCRGGDGGQGLVLIAYSGGATKAGHESFPDGVSSMMVIADGSGAFKKLGPPPAIVYGGITKDAYVLDDGKFVSIPHFFVGTTASGGPVGVKAFTGDAGDAVDDLIAKVPDGHVKSGAVALFPCFTRGINQYGENDIEPKAISAKLPGCRIFGMFAHGELGPASFTGFSPTDDAALDRKSVV